MSKILVSGLMLNWRGKCGGRLDEHEMDTRLLKRAVALGQ
jgi:hypothetical protein